MNEKTDQTPKQIVTTTIPQNLTYHQITRITLSNSKRFSNFNSRILRIETLNVPANNFLVFEIGLFADSDTNLQIEEPATVADKARLEWLEKRIFASGYAVTFQQGRTPDRITIQTGVGSGPSAKQHVGFDLRRAIDKAMKDDDCV